ncbi:uncharacterized protein [Cicer arietinum]|uniref:uncharacterized protein n=1 Tax=Cicer arietinum TaxID=3827 RepID=UPI003CC67879
MLVSKVEPTAQDGDSVYHGPRFAPTSMDLDKPSKGERNASRRDKEILKQAQNSNYIKTLMNDMEERPEEIKDFDGASREVDNYISKMEKRAKVEVDGFMRIPLTKEERKKEKYLKKVKNGMQGLTDSLFDEIKGLPFEDNTGDHAMAYKNGSKRNGKLKKRKRKH